MTMLRTSTLSLLLCSFLAACGGGGSDAPTSPVVVMQINSNNVDRVFATYLLEQYRTVNEIEQFRAFTALAADRTAQATTTCPNGGTVKNFTSLRFEFDQCASGVGKITSGALDSDAIGIMGQARIFYRGLKYRFTGDGSDVEFNGNSLAQGDRNLPINFAYTYLRNGITTTYTRASTDAPGIVKIVTSEFMLNLAESDAAGNVVPTVLAAADGSNLTVTRRSDGGAQVDIRNGPGQAIISTKPYTTAEVASLLAAARTGA